MKHPKGRHFDQNEIQPTHPFPRHVIYVGLPHKPSVDIFFLGIEKLDDEKVLITPQLKAAEEYSTDEGSIAVIDKDLLHNKTQVLPFMITHWIIKNQIHGNPLFVSHTHRDRGILDLLTFRHGKLIKAIHDLPGNTKIRHDNAQTDLLAYLKEYAELCRGPEHFIESISQFLLHAHFSSQDIEDTVKDFEKNIALDHR